MTASLPPLTALWLLQGVGKGMLGLVIKPVVGLTDAATDVLRGVQSTAGASSTAEQLTQLRPKRYADSFPTKA